MRPFRPFLVPAILIVAWILGSSLHLWNSYLLPSPLRTIQSAGRLIVSGLLLKNTAVSFYRVAIGFLVAFALAFPTGLCMGLTKNLLPYFESVLEFIRHIPPLAVIPVVILWFGIGETSKLVIIVLASFFPVYINTLSGVRNSNRKLVEVGQSIGMNGWRRLGRIVLPSALPSILAGARLGLGYSWRALIGAELIASSSGLGYMILDAEQLSRIDIVFVGILTIGILGSVIDWLFFRLTDLCAPWHRDANVDDEL